MSTAHRCAAIGCTRQIPLRRAFCEEHWSALPQPLRARIVAHLLAATIGPEAARPIAETRRLAAVREAMDVLRSKGRQNQP